MQLYLEYQRSSTCGSKDIAHRDWEGQNHQWDYGPTIYNFNRPYHDLMGHQNILKGHFKPLYTIEFPTVIIPVIHVTVLIHGF
jgi:hypothetical protein